MPCGLPYVEDHAFCEAHQNLTRNAMHRALDALPSVHVVWPLISIRQSLPRPFAPVLARIIVSCTPACQNGCFGLFWDVLVVSENFELSFGIFMIKEIKWTSFPLFQVNKRSGKFTSWRSKLLSVSDKMISKENWRSKLTKWFRKFYLEI